MRLIESKLLSIWRLLIVGGLIQIPLLLQQFKMKMFFTIIKKNQQIRSYGSGVVTFLEAVISGVKVISLYQMPSQLCVEVKKNISKLKNNVLSKFL